MFLVNFEATWKMEVASAFSNWRKKNALAKIKISIAISYKKSAPSLTNSGPKNTTVPSWRALALSGATWKMHNTHPCDAFCKNNLLPELAMRQYTRRNDQAWRFRNMRNKKWSPCVTTKSIQEQWWIPSERVLNSEHFVKYVLMV